MGLNRRLFTLRQVDGLCAISEELGGVESEVPIIKFTVSALESSSRFGEYSRLR